MKNLVKCLIMILLLALVLVGADYGYDAIVRETAAAQTPGGGQVTDWAKPDPEHLAYYGLGEFETNLPVLYIDTRNQRIQKEDIIWASMAVSEAMPDGSPRSVMDTPDYQASITLKYRGASSYSGFDKRQYRIKFFEEEGSTAAMPVSFVGMGSNSEWVLNGPFLDKTLMRNRLGYALSGEIMDWAPDTRYVELFLDGEYQGVYLATEPVSNGEFRLRLSKFGLLNGSTSYIVKRDRVGTELNAIETYGKTGGYTVNDLYIEYPGNTKLTRQQTRWITQDISTFEEALYGADFADPVKGYAGYIDVDSFVDYYIINELLMNHDAGNLSTYAYKELGGKLQMCVWDFNNCLDNYQWFRQDYTEFYIVKNAWFNRLLQDKNFVRAVRSRYEELRETTLSDEHVFALLDSYQQEMGAAIDRNFAVWGYTFSTDLLSTTVEEAAAGDIRDPGSYKEAVEQLKQLYSTRAAYLDEHFADLKEGCVN